jgi:hypothetical protein
MRSASSFDAPVCGGAFVVAAAMPGAISARRPACAIASVSALSESKRCSCFFSG